MLVLSSVIVTFGLLLNNIAVIIGGMLVTPILFPILSLSMGVVVGDRKLMKRGGIVIARSAGVVVIISALISLMFISKEITPEIVSRVSSNLAYFLIALFSGAAAAYALSRPSESEVLPGVAITVALIPPLSVLGIAISLFQWEMIVGSLGLFFFNLIGITFSALVVFSILQFHEIKDVIEKKIKAEERVIKAEQKEKEKSHIQELEKTVRQATEVLKEKKKNNT
ncbi:TIGR00341 family protein [Patescibacteria group bacterium AH-259-L07]|nr:TIGR00341 family protein [Patescibacteria group bacterium AH-259-L07]